jgi:hypothetical protein
MRAVRRLNHEINTGLASLTLKSRLSELWHNPNGRFGYELRNLRTTSNFMTLMPLLNPKFAIAVVAGVREL